MNRKLLFIPLVLFLALAAALFWQLMRNAEGDDPTTLESALIGKPLPEFRLEALDTPGQTLDRRTLIDGKPLLLNVWATWVSNLSRRASGFSTAWRSRACGWWGDELQRRSPEGDELAAAPWGNPYRLSLYDGNGMLGLDLGVYGAPETFSHRRSGHYPLAARRRPERTGVARGAPAAVGSIATGGRADERGNGHPAGADADRPGVGRHRYLAV